MSARLKCSLLEGVKSSGIGPFCFSGKTIKQQVNMSDELTSDIAYLIGLELSHGEASLVGEETLEVELPPPHSRRRIFCFSVPAGRGG
jgi:hypothetical protein